MMRHVVFALSLMIAPMAACAADVNRADVIVYTATAGGVTASVAAARQGAKVILLEPRKHVGGMLSGGLGGSDVHGQEDLIGGLAYEVFNRMAGHYHKKDAKAAFDFEPHVAEDTLRAMLHDAGVQVIFGERLASLEKNKRCIASIKTESGAMYAANVFIDAGYEGDLMARAGVHYAVGREGRAKYDESLAGRRELIPGTHQFVFPVSATVDGKVLPFVTPQDRLVPTGEGDGKIQGYCFRLCLTDNVANQIPIEEPPDYNPDDYELLRRHFIAGGDKAPKACRMKRLPRRKCDLNSAGPVSTNLLGASYEYPDASYERRDEIWRRHLSWTHGLLWFLRTDLSVPIPHAEEMNRWGLCKDEFVDTGGWPHQLYIREGRRMLGAYVVTQNDLASSRTQPDSVGMCGYNIDLREVQWVAARTFRFPYADDEAYIEGYVSEPVQPWQIPYRALLPKSEECQNLLVSTCTSMSTVAFGSFRMEPNYMIAGHASGVAAALAARENVAVQDVRYEELRRLLTEQGQIVERPATRAQ